VPAWLAILGAAGATYVVTQGVIARRLRSIYPPLLCCPMCSGFWVGAIVAALWLAYPHLPAFVGQAVQIVLFAFGTSLVASAACVVLVTVGSHRKELPNVGPANEPCERLKPAQTPPED